MNALFRYFYFPKHLSGYIKIRLFHNSNLQVAEGRATHTAMSPSGDDLPD